MMNLIYTLLTLAGGILVGTAGVLISQKNTDHATQALLWCVIMLPLFYGSVALGVWSENQVHPHPISTIFSLIMVVVIWIYGVCNGILIHFRQELKQVMLNPKRSEHISITCSQVLLILPPIFWAVLSIFSPWDCYISLAASATVSLIIMTVLWIALHLAWFLLYYKKST